MTQTLHGEGQLVPRTAACLTELLGLPGLGRNHSEADQRHHGELGRNRPAADFSRAAHLPFSLGRRRLKKHQALQCCYGINRNMQRLYSLLLKSSILLVVFTIQGCAPVVYSYPETWPSPLIADDQDCQNISGTYMNAGDTSDETYRKEFLFDMITNEGFMGKHECTNCTVKLAWHNSDLSELLSWFSVNRSFPVHG